MGDIDFEEQLELEKLEQEHKAKLASEGKGERVDPDGTVYEWDTEKQAWFPKIDSDFIAQYQMNYGEGEGTEGDKDKQVTDYEKYYNYYQNYNQAQLQHEALLNKKKNEVQDDESHEETLQKLETLENRMQEQGDTGQQPGDYQPDSKEEMENYTEEQKKQYNEYWSYYYNTDYHDYYADCIAQYASETKGGESEEKKEEDKDGKTKGKKRKGQQPQRDEGWFNVDEQHNTNVYVSGLPLDTTPEEFKEMMNKYGLIMNDPRTRQPKLKLYMDENGQPKGDGRCCFIKKESVDLILNLLDGSDYKGHKIKVERAQFQLKGDYDPSKKKKKLTNKEKRRLKERQAKLFDWRPDKPRGTRLKHEKVVVLKNVFDPKTFEDDPVQINVLTRDIRTECAKYGEVKKVVVFDRHQDGVVTVHFKEPEEADMCIENTHQRFFAQRRLLAATWDGQTKYEIEETEAERTARLKKWEKFLETGEQEPGSGNPATTNANNGSSVSSASNTENKLSEKSEEQSRLSSESAADDSKIVAEDTVSANDKVESTDGASKVETKESEMETDSETLESAVSKGEEKT